MKIEIPEQKKLVFEMTIPIRWGDMDAMNHVNNTTYFNNQRGQARISCAHTGEWPKGVCYGNNRLDHQAGTANPDLTTAFIDTRRNKNV